MFRGKIKGRKGNDQGGVVRKKAKNVVNLKVCRDYLRTSKGEFYLCCLTTQAGSSSAALLKSFSYLCPALVIGFLCVLQAESYFM